MCSEEGFMFELMTYCTIMHCHTVQFIFRLFVYALGIKAMEINAFDLIDHQLILLKNFIFDLLIELVRTPNCVTY